MTIVATAPYQEALSGEPLDRAIVAPMLDTTSTLWTLGGWAPVLPAPNIRPAPGLQQITRQIRTWTGWSTRKLAEVLGTSHTTVRAIEQGRPLIDGHSGNLWQRLNEAHDVIERTWWLASRDATRVAFLLDSGDAGHSAADELRRDNASSAYLAVIDALRSRQPGLIVGDRPRRGGATTALHG